MQRSYDDLIIGTGQAGPPLAARLSAAGRRVAIVERDRVGGSCVNVGCIPTKTLVASARAAHMARRGPDFGVVLAGAPRVDMRAVNARMKRVSGESNAGVTSWLEGLDGVDLLRGDARFEAPRRVRVGDDLLDAERVFLNVGARARVPADLPGVDRVPYLDNVSMMELDTLPDHLVIVGGSYIALEFGQMFRRFGSRVTIVQRGPRLLGREDEDIAAAIRDVLEGEGVDVRCGATCTGLARAGSGVRVEIAAGDVDRSVEGSHVLLAVGRVPNTDGLGLDAAGIDTDAHGYVVVDDELCTSAESVWALGDCNGRGAFTHTSYNDFEIVAANLLDGDSRRVGDRIPCYGVFVDPPLGRVGMTESQARESGRSVLVGRRPMARVGRARERSETAGFIKVLVDGDSDRILGAGILGVNGDEVVHVLLALMYADAPSRVLARSVPIHPTVAELLPTVLQNLEPLER